MKKSVIYLGLALVTFGNVAMASNEISAVKNQVELTSYVGTPLNVAISKGDLETVKKFIEYGNVFVNNKIINYTSYHLNFNEIVSFNKRYYKRLYFFIKSQLRRRKVLVNSPNFIEADYKLLVAMLIRNPNELSLTKPLSFNLYTKFPSINR